MRRRDEILIASAAVLAMLFAVLLLACSLPRPECPLGAYPAAVDTDTSGDRKSTRLNSSHRL